MINGENMITKTNYKVGIYLRLSREDEKLGESSSISTQREMLLNYIRDNDLCFVDEYIDDGVSGTTFDRIGFKKMIKDCEEKKINMIITKDTSRLGRDHIEFGYYVERYFPEHNIRYVAVNDGVDTFKMNNSANDMLVFKSAFNDMYVKDISNKLRSSLYTKKRNGLFVGAYAPYGYKKSKDNKNKLEIDLETANVVRRIFDMFISGYSIPKICDVLTKEHIKTPSISKNMRLGQRNVHFGVWSTTTVSDILNNPTYIGNLTQCKNRKVNYKSKKRIHTQIDDWIIAEGAVEAIIDKETFKLASDMIKSNKNRGIKGNGITDKLLLRGLIYCKECKHTIGFRDHKSQTKKYGLVHRIYGNCNYWQKRKKQNVCSPHFIKYEKVEKLVINNLTKIVKEYLDINNFDKILEKSNKLKNKKNNIRHEINRLEQVIENYNKKIDICYNDKLEGNITIDIYKRVYNNLTIEVDNLVRLKQEYEKKLSDLKKNNNNYYLDKVKDLLDLSRPSRALISTLIDRIEIDEDKKIYIYYSFKLL